MNGSEKQIKWANDIKAAFMAQLPLILESPMLNDKGKEMVTGLFAKADAIEDATWWIANDYLAIKDFDAKKSGEWLFRQLHAKIFA